MLPSTGYFKGINCPFYETGLCERPYCHFKHARRDPASATMLLPQRQNQTILQQQTQILQPPQIPNITSSTNAPPIAVSTASGAANPDVLQKLVTDAVKKILADQYVQDTERLSQNIVSKVVEGLKPSLVPSMLPIRSLPLPQPQTPSLVNNRAHIGKHNIGVPVIPITKPPTSVPSSSCVYNPTPIAELRRRHLPIPSQAVPSYMPIRDNKVTVKRKSSDDSDKPWMDVIRNIPGINKDNKKISYTPTLIGQSSFNPTTTSSILPSTNLYQITSTSNDYIPDGGKKKHKETYFPKTKKRREEYVPRKPKRPIKNKELLEAEDDDDIILLQPNYGDDNVLDDSETNPDIFMNEVDGIKINDSPKSDDVKEEHEEEEDEKEDEEQEMDEDEEQNSYEEEIVNDKKKQIVQDKPKTKSSSSSSTSNKHSTKSNKENSKHINHKDKTRRNSKEGNSDKLKRRSRDKSRERSRSRDRRERSKDKRSKDKNKDHHSENRSKDKSKEKHRHSSSKKSGSSNKSKDRERSKSQDRERSRDSHKRKKESRADKQRSSNVSEDSKMKNVKDKSKSNSSSHKENKNKLSESSKNKTSKHSSSTHKSSSKNESLHSSQDKRSNSKSSKQTDKQIDKVQKGKNEDSDIEDKKNECSEPEESAYDSPELPEFSPYFDEVVIDSELSDSEHDVEEECRKIFQDCDETVDFTSKAAPKDKQEKVEDIGKKRIAHSGADTVSIKNFTQSQPKLVPRPEEEMYKRWRMMKEVAEENSKSNSDHQINGNVMNALKRPREPGRVRIAHVPYAMSLALEKKKVLESVGKKEEIKTVAQTSKGGRVAHIPQAMPQLIRPQPLQMASRKFPINVRQHYVNMMHDICIEIYDTADEAAQRSLSEEISCHDRCKALNVYKNSCMLAVHRLRKEKDQNQTLKEAVSGLVSHEDILSGKNKGSWSIIKHKKSSLEFKGESLYNMLLRWLMTEEELKQNGFPRPHPDGVKSHAKIYTSFTKGKSTLSKVPNERFCCRCGKSFKVDVDGYPLRQENCIYHWARKYTFRGESKYSCCKQESSLNGCSDAAHHVWDYVDPDNQTGYVETFNKDNPDNKRGVFALDCEMCYTTEGLELARVTVIGEECNVVYETLVKPDHVILDYNTRFSGITEEDMESVTTTLRDVQTALLTMFSSETILIGHSLESDFRALKLIHSTVVDTSIMFPHKLGPPNKRALKNLCSDYLRKIIQEDVGGHDSKEDAVACMELVLWKVKEEAKLL